MAATPVGKSGKDEYQLTSRTPNLRSRIRADQDVRVFVTQDMNRPEFEFLVRDDVKSK